MPAPAPIHRDGVIFSRDRLVDRRILVVAGLAAPLGSAGCPSKRYRQVASAAGGNRRRCRADFCAGARAAGCRWLPSQRMRTVTAPNPAASVVQFLCTPFGAAGAGPGNGIWTFDLWITAPLMLSLVLYGIGTFALWRRAGW